MADILNRILDSTAVINTDTSLNGRYWPPVAGAEGGAGAGGAAAVFGVADAAAVGLLSTDLPAASLTDAVVIVIAAFWVGILGIRIVWLRISIRQGVDLHADPCFGSCGHSQTQQEGG